MDIGIGVPAPPEAFVGRLQELDYLGGWLRPGRSLALVAEAGVTGVGRTALARAFAHRTRAFGGVLGWTIQADGPRPHAALRRWAVRLGAPVKGRASLEQLLAGIASALRTAGPVLLVIDGVRVRDVASVQRVLGALPPEACVLLTVDDPRAAETIGLRTLEIAPLSDDEGLELLEVVIGSAVPAIIGGAMLQAVGYLPLGIRIAGSRLRQASGEESGSWGGEVDPRRAARLGGPIGVARSFLDVYRRLGDGTSRVLRSLGLFLHGVVNAERVGALLGLDTQVAEAELDRLVGYGLLDVVDAGEWLMHPLVSGYAMRLLEESGELDRLQKRRLALVMQSEGIPGGGLTPSDIHDVVHRAIDRGDVEDLVALGTRIGDELASWCLEDALALVGDAHTLARKGKSRALGILKTRHEALLASAGALGVKDEDIRLDAADLDERMFDARPTREALGAPRESGAREEEEAPAVAEAPPVSDAAPDPVAEPGFAPVVPETKLASEDAWWVVRPDTAEALVAKKASEDWSTAPRVQSASQVRLTAQVGEVERHPEEEVVAEAESTGVQAVRAIRSLSAEGAEDDRLHGVSKHAAHMRGDSTDQVRTDCLARARAAAATASEIQERLSARLEEGERDLRGRQDLTLRGPIDRVTALTRSVVDQVRAARAAVPVIEHAGDLERMRRAAERAERARDAAVEAVAEADDLWTSFYDALSNLQEFATRRRAAVQRARSEATAGRAAVDDAANRLAAWRVSDPDAGWAEADALLTKARAAAARADIVFASIEMSPDPEAAASLVGAACAEADRLAQEVVSLGQRVVENGREISRSKELRREVGDHVDRIERDARAFDALCDGFLVRLAGATDDTAQALVRRLDALSTRVHRGRKLASSQGAVDGTPAGIERLAATGRDVAVCLVEAQRAGEEVEAWSTAHAAADVDDGREARLADALTALAAMESAAAVARRASSRARGAADGVEDVAVAQAAGQLEAQEATLRDTLDAARQAVEAIDGATSKDAAESAAQAASAAIDAAQASADRTRTLAESMITLADGSRQVLLDAAREEGRGLAERVVASTVEVAQLADEAEELAGTAGAAGDGWRDAIRAAVVRISDAREAVEEGERRLSHYGDPALLARVVETMQDAADVAAAAMIEVEVARMKLRALAGRAVSAARATATQALVADEPTDPSVSLLPVEEPTPAQLPPPRPAAPPERTVPVVRVAAQAVVAGEATVPSIGPSPVDEGEEDWEDEMTVAVERGQTLPLSTAARATSAVASTAERTVPVAEVAAERTDELTPATRVVASVAAPAEPAEVTMTPAASKELDPVADAAQEEPDAGAEGAGDVDDYDMFDAPVTDADRAEAAVAVALARVRADQARAAFDRARRALSPSSDRGVWAALVEGRSMLASEAGRMHDGIDDVHGLLACAHRVSFLAESMLRLASEFGPGPLPAPVERGEPTRAAPPPAGWDRTIGRDLAAWEVAAEAWSAGWDEPGVAAARDVVRVAIGEARRAPPADRAAAHAVAHDAIDALAFTLRDAASARDAAWSDPTARGASHARAAWAALRAEDLSGALEQARAAVRLSDAPAVRLTASLVLRALGRLVEAESCLDGVDHPLAGRVRAAEPGPLPLDALERSGLVAVAARDAIH